MVKKSIYNHEYVQPSKGLLSIDKYYYILFALFFLFFAILNWCFNLSLVKYNGYLILLSFTSLTAVSDIRRDVKKGPFLIVAIPYIIFILIVLIFGNDIWHDVLKWEMDRTNPINLNSLFTKIPFNDASFARIFQPAWLTYYMKVVYTNGFVLAVIIPFFRAALTLDFKKMLKYTLSAHIFQVLIVTPFYVTFYVQNVWFVYGHADPLARHMTYAQAAQSTLNGFPSMHTSIAFAMFLLVLRERNTLFKWVWGFFCLSVIYSTMYLEIHWVVDVIAGLVFGYLVVKLVDYLLYNVNKVFSHKFNNSLRIMHGVPILYYKL